MELTSGAHLSLLLKKKTSSNTHIHTAIDFDNLTLRSQKFIRITFEVSIPTTQKTLCLHYIDLKVNTVWGNNRSLLRKSYRTHKYTEGKIQSFFILTKWYI
jgi:hypothetical protein